MNSIIKKIISYLYPKKPNPLLEDPKPEWMKKQIDFDAEHGDKIMISVAIFLLLLTVLGLCC